MTCVTHPGVEATAYCRICGRAMCTDCKRDVNGAIYCEACMQRETYARNNPVVGPPQGPIPGLAFGLGFIPGVGAIYNGQYAKAFVHVVIFGVLCSVISSGEARGYEPLLGMMIPCYIAYMAFEAFHTAKKRLLGQPVDEWSGLFDSGSGSPDAPSAPSAGARSGGAIFLIALGVLLLLSNLNLLSLSAVLKWWPLILVGVGAKMLVGRLTDGPPSGGMRGGL